MLNFPLMLRLALVENMALTLDREAKALHEASEQAYCDPNRNRDGRWIICVWRFNKHATKRQVIGRDEGVLEDVVWGLGMVDPQLSTCEAIRHTSNS